jgi:hypothetical protein
MVEALGEGVACTGSIGGKLVLESLDKEDYDTITKFHSGLGTEAKDADRFDLAEFTGMTMQIKACLEANFKAMPPAEARGHIENFLKSHNTCTLCTASGTVVRGTPIEYRYKDGYIYMVSEGGEKFANILANKQVCIAVYDPYAGWSTVAGLQLAGEVVEIIQDPASEAYKKVAEPWGLNQQKTAGMRYVLNGLVIKLGEAEFFSAANEQKGYHVKQFYRFA